MYGRSVRTPLGKSVDWVVDYDDFENKGFEQRQFEKVNLIKVQNSTAL